VTEQLSFFGPALNQVINVAQVKHRSPLRYPGGKTWLVPRARQWVASLPERPAKLIEPFCGGAIVSLSLVFDDLVDHATLVELDEQVAAMWETIISDEGGGEWLAARIEGFELTPESVKEVLGYEGNDLRRRAFQTVVQNRTSRGGILAAGAGRIKYGEAGKGISSRWYPTTLANRIRDIVSVRERLDFIHGNGLRVLRDNLHRSDAVAFIDPPYTAGGKRAGNRLYNYSELDHEALFSLAQAFQGDFLMTYDNAPEVQELADQHGFDTLAVAMKNTHHARMDELLIGRSLDWARY
jgi:DNA adenine methylase